jgi:hypothetical protein
LAELYSRLKNYEKIEMTPLKMMQADLPNMPTDVIDIWLSTFYNRFGWPPELDNEWRYVLGQGNDLAFLQKLAWQQQEIQLSPELLEPSSRQMIVDLFRTYVLGHTTIYTSMSDGPERFRSCCEFIRSHKKFPRPVVLRQSTNGYHILDGNHRLTAFFYLFGWFNIKNDETPDPELSDVQTTWIGTLG